MSAFGNSTQSAVTWSNFIWDRPNFRFFCENRYKIEIINIKILPKCCHLAIDVKVVIKELQFQYFFFKTYITSNISKAAHFLNRHIVTISKRLKSVAAVENTSTPDWNHQQNLMFYKFLQRKILLKMCHPHGKIKYLQQAWIITTNCTYIVTTQRLHTFVETVSKESTGLCGKINM